MTTNNTSATMRAKLAHARGRALAAILGLVLVALTIPTQTARASEFDERSALVNLALDAVAGADKQNTPVENVNNGYFATNAATSWNTWSNTEISYPTSVWLEWDEPQELVGSRVVWWADSSAIDGNDSVTFPKSAVIEYRDENGQWVRLEDMRDEEDNPTDQVGVKYDTNDGNGLNGANRYWNEVLFADAITTTALRMLIDRNGTGRNGIGISQWEAYGYRDGSVGPGLAQGKNIAPEATVTADYQNSGTSTANVNNMVLATDNTTSWNTWASGGDLQYPQPLQLSWDEPREVQSMRVMWWADQLQLSAGGVQYPKNASLQYWDHKEDQWVDVVGMVDELGETVDSVGTSFTNGQTQGGNRYWNGVIVDHNNPVKTTKIRLLIDRPDGLTDLRSGIGVGEWEVYGETIQDELIAANISGKSKVLAGSVSQYHATVLPSTYESNFAYEWSVEGDVLEIEGLADQSQVDVVGTARGQGLVKLSLTDLGTGEKRNADFAVAVEEISDIETYHTATVAGTAPILPKTVVANGIEFDAPTPEEHHTGQKTVAFNFAESFDSKLVPVEWDPIDPTSYAADKVGTSFTVTGRVTEGGLNATALAEIRVNPVVESPETNVPVTFENVILTDDFWRPKQKVNMTKSLEAAIYQIGLASGGEPNFVNSVKKLNGEPYSAFQGFVFQDTDIYKTLEAVSYTLSALQDETDPELLAQKSQLEETLARWVDLIQQVQYADGYINTHFTLRASNYAGGRAPGTHRWRNFNNHEMYNAGHFIESAVAYTRYREGIEDPDYSLYVAAKRYADSIVALFGPDGTRHEVPGHEEIELALTKFSELVEEYEGAGSGEKYVKTAQTLIDRRGEDTKLRDSQYDGYSGGDRKYSQDRLPFTQESEAVGHAVRAAYLYTGATDVARLTGGQVEHEYLNALDNVWDSVANKKSYITGSIGVASHGEDFGADFELPNNDSYAETCASIALANWNLRMNLVHEDARYADAIERSLYNAILSGVNLEGDQFYYSSRLEVPAKNGGYVNRSSWFDCACCPPNLMRTLAKLSEYMYTTHGNDVFVNLFIGSEAKLNVSGTKVVVTQRTDYPNDGMVELVVDPAEAKEFAIKVRVPNWLEGQNNNKPVFRVNDQAIVPDVQDGYAEIIRVWEPGDRVSVDMPMEVKLTEAHESVSTNKDKVAIERGPLVFAIEKAGNIQKNQHVDSFDPRKVTIPRDNDLSAKVNEDLLGGIVEITGSAEYATDLRGSQSIEVQAVPFFAHNNRSDTEEYQALSRSTGMVVWANATGERAEPADRSELLALIGEVEGLNERNYTTSSWSILQEALSDAKVVAGDDSATAEQIASALLALQTAFGALVQLQVVIPIEPTFDNSVCDEEPELKLPNVTGVTYDIVKNGPEWTVTATPNEGFTFPGEQQSVAWEYDAEIRECPSGFDKSALLALVAEAESLDESDYTKETWSDLASALANAKETVDNENANEADIELAAAALRAAIDGLIAVDVLLLEVSPLAPEWVPAVECGAKPTVLIPDVEGVDYSSSLTQDTLVVRALPAEGYTFASEAASMRCPA